MLNLHTLNNGNYETQRFDLVKAMEGSENETYADNKGWATVGVGFNLSDDNVLTAVLDELAPAINADTAKFIELDSIASVNYGSNNTTAARNAINAKMAEFHAGDASIPTTLAFSNQNQIFAVFNALSTTYETVVDIWYGGAIANSVERTVLFSFAYNQQNSNPLLGGKLKAAIQDGDRAEAWYEIRHNSNGGNDNGIANRRYAESEVFKLYDDENNGVYIPN